MKKILLVVMCNVLVLSSCGKENVTLEEMHKMQTVAEESTGETQEIIMPIDNFIPDCMEEEYNVLGNHYANLNYGATGGYRTGGRITEQGGYIYWYEKKGIWKQDKEKNKTMICGVNDALSLNVVGDYLYYLEESNIYKIRVDGKEKELLFEGVYGPFFVACGAIIYVTSQNTSATNKAYYINCYDMENQIIKYSILIGDKEPLLLWGNPLEAVYCFQDVAQGTDYATYICEYRTGEILRSSFAISVKGWPYSDRFWTIMSDNYSGFMQNGSDQICYYYSDYGSIHRVYRSDVVKGFQIWNFYGEDLIATIYNNGTNKVVKISQDTIWGSDDKLDEWVGECDQIFYEKTSFNELYVVGDYLYYTIDYNYDSCDVYRIKIDGSGWEQL